MNDEGENEDHGESEQHPAEGLDQSSGRWVGAADFEPGCAANDNREKDGWSGN